MKKGYLYSCESAGDVIAQVHLEDEDSVIVEREREREEGFGAVDISFHDHVVRIYDDKPWRVRHMNSAGTQDIN